jgi:hypothetical protein
VRRSGLVFALVLAPALQGRVEAQNSGGNPLQNVSPAEPGQLTSTEIPQLPLTADALQGPPNPATMYALTRMSDGQMAQYLAAYRAHMAATWNERVATMSALGMMGRALRNADANRVRYYGLVLDRLWGRLRAQDQGFGMALGSILEGKQLDSYRAWRRAWEQGTRAQQRLQVSLIEYTALVR